MYKGFPDTRNITDNRGEVSGAFSLSSPVDGKIPVVTGGVASPRITTVRVFTYTWLMYFENGQFENGVEKNNAYITLKLGNLENRFISDKDRRLTQVELYWSIDLLIAIRIRVLTLT